MPDDSPDVLWETYLQYIKRFFTARANARKTAGPSAHPPEVTCTGGITLPAPGVADGE